MVTNEDRKVIDLMIIGAQKAGTTSLNNYLAEHPELLGHSETEFGFFGHDELYQAGFDAAFARYFDRGSIGSSKYTVAKNASLYTMEHAIQRLHAHNPGCKLVFLVREPVARAYSAYAMEVFNGWMKRDFSELRTLMEEEDHADVMFRFFIRMGFYAEHLKMVQRYFPREQVRVFLFEDLKRDPLMLCRDIFEWIGVRTDFIPKVEVTHNRSGQARSLWLTRLISKLNRRDAPLSRLAKAILPYRTISGIRSFLFRLNRSSRTIPPISPEMKEFLHDYYRPHVQELERMTGLDLAHAWK